MNLRNFISKQYIDVIQWTEAENGVLATRYPMQDMEIQSGAQLTVRESQLALLVDQGTVADQFGPEQLDHLDQRCDCDGNIRSDVNIGHNRLQSG